MKSTFQNRRHESLSPCIKTHLEPTKQSWLQLRFCCHWACSKSRSKLVCCYATVSRSWGIQVWWCRQNVVDILYDQSDEIWGTGVNGSRVLVKLSSLSRRVWHIYFSLESHHFIPLFLWHCQYFRSVISNLFLSHIRRYVFSPPLCPQNF